MTGMANPRFDSSLKGPAHDLVFLVKRARLANDKVSDNLELGHLDHSCLSSYFYTEYTRSKKAWQARLLFLSLFLIFTRFSFKFDDLSFCLQRTSFKGFALQWKIGWKHKKMAFYPYFFHFVCYALCILFLRYILLWIGYRDQHKKPFLTHEFLVVALLEVIFPCFHHENQITLRIVGESDGQWQGSSATWVCPWLFESTLLYGYHRWQMRLLHQDEGSRASFKRSTRNSQSCFWPTDRSALNHLARYHSHSARSDKVMDPAAHCWRPLNVGNIGLIRDHGFPDSPFKEPRVHLVRPSKGITWTFFTRLMALVSLYNQPIYQSLNIVRETHQRWPWSSYAAPMDQQ